MWGLVTSACPRGAVALAAQVTANAVQLLGETVQTLGKAQAQVRPRGFFAACRTGAFGGRGSRGTSRHLRLLVGQLRQGTAVLRVRRDRGASRRRRHGCHLGAFVKGTASKRPMQNGRLPII